jgi:hypothetical protein
MEKGIRGRGDTREIPVKVNSGEGKERNAVKNKRRIV